MSKQQADDMVALMNKILSRQLDPKLVYSQLDKIQGALASIGDAVSPLAKAPAFDVALLDESQKLTHSCESFLQVWNMEMAKRLNFSGTLPSSNQNQDATEMYNNSAKLDESRAEEFQKQLAGRIQTLAAQLIRVLPSPIANRRIAPWHIRPLISPSIKNFYDFAKILEGLTQILGQYSDPTKVANPDPLILESLKSLRSECVAFQRSWTVDQTNGAMATPAMARMTKTTELQGELEQERAAEFAKTLAPQLEAWRLKVLQRDSDIHAGMTYLKADSFVEANQICNDVYSVANLFRTKVVADIRKNTISK